MFPIADVPLMHVGIVVALSVIWPSSIDIRVTRGRIRIRWITSGADAPRVRLKIPGLLAAEV